MALCVLGWPMLGIGQSSPELVALEREIFHQVYQQPLEVYGKAWRLVAEARSQHDVAMESKAHYYLSTICGWRNELDSTRYHAQRAIDLALQTKNEDAISNGYNMLGNAFESLGQLDSAYYAFDQSRIHGEKSMQPKNVSRALLNMGIIHRTRGEYLPALERLNQAKVRCVEHNFRTYLPNLYLTIGEVYLQIGDHEQAYENLHASLRSARGNKQMRVAANALKALGNHAWSIRDSNEAICWYRASRDAARAAEIPSTEGQASAQMAAILIAQGERAAAREAAMVAQEIAARDHDTITLSIAYLALGQIDLEVAQFGSAHRWCKQAYALAMQAGQNSTVVKSCDCLWRSAERGGLWQAAFQYHRIYEHLKDSLLNQENTLAIARLEARADYEQRHKADSLMQMASNLQRDIAYQKELDEEKLRTRTSLWIGLSIGLLAILASVAVFLFRRQNQRLISQNKQIQIQNEAIQTSLQEKQVLLQEVHHRVKNNLQVMTSLLEMQAAKLDDPSAIEVLLASKGRVQAMSLIHQKLFQQDKIADLDFASYMQELAMTIGALYPDGQHIQMHFAMEACRFGVDTAMPLGLILNELITNAYKYAFAGKAQGRLQLALHRLESDQFEMQVQDDGPGWPPDFDKGGIQTLGMQLVQGLTRQLKGRVDFGRSEWGGTKISVIFNVQQP